MLALGAPLRRRRTVVARTGSLEFGPTMLRLSRSDRRDHPERVTTGVLDQRRRHGASLAAARKMIAQGHGGKDSTASQAGGRAASHWSPINCASKATVICADPNRVGWI